MDLMKPAQVYSTTLFDRHQPQNFSFHFIPARCFANNSVPQMTHIETTLEAVRHKTTPDVTPWHLPALLATLLASAHAPARVAEIDVVDQWSRGSPLNLDPYQLGFAEYVSFSDVIPVEESPIKGKSLMSIAAAAGVQIGLVAGLYGPLIIVTVPMGIVLCTAAVEFGPLLGQKLAKLLD